jgi:hypothetical protein
MPTLILPEAQIEMYKVSQEGRTAQNTVASYEILYLITVASKAVNSMSTHTERNTRKLYTVAQLCEN